MLVYTSSISSRLQYVIRFIESFVEGKIDITNNKEHFLQYKSIKINYSDTKICEDEYHIIPHTLLFQKSIQPIEIIITECRNNPCFFINEDDHGFDLFAAIFYLITRYEEYHSHQKDMYGRYAHTNSIAYRNNFLTIPLVNIWIKDLLLQLPTSNFQLPTFSFTPTYDIDIAFAYKHQPMIRNVGGFFKDLIKGDLEKVIERANVYSGAKQDPFDTYHWLDALHKHHQLSPIYFFLLAAKKGVYDKNIEPSSIAMHQLVKQHAVTYMTGIHPSWQSGDDDTLLKEEVDSFIKITNKDCSKSRQHYIRLTLPETYRTLIKNGITEDYSMGYGSINGFRASVASPFYWYDLEKEEESKLLIHPFCFMEANSYFEQHLSAEEAGKELKYYHDIVKQVGGQLITIFHNHFLTEQPQWKPWREMYANFLSNLQ